MKPQIHSPLRIAFESHPSRWRSNAYVYPVVSRRSRGLSVGINLNPDLACNFDCVYCQVDRTRPPRIRSLDLRVLADELRTMLADLPQIFEDEAFRGVPDVYRELRDVAFSGDGEPTAAPEFPAAVRLVGDALRDAGRSGTPIVLITNAFFLGETRVRAAVEELCARGGEVWAKLDAGSDAYFRRVCGVTIPLTRILENIRETGARHPIVVQSMFLRLFGQGPDSDEIDAYVRRLTDLVSGGCAIRRAQIYTVARRTARPFVSALPGEELAAIAARVQAAGVSAEWFA